jgi:hypothetical protein
MGIEPDGGDPRFAGGGGDARFAGACATATPLPQIAAIAQTRIAALTRFMKASFLR